MKTAVNHAAKQHAAKQKKQLVVLGALGLVLALVLVVQFGGEDGEAEIVAMAAPEEAFNADSGEESMDEEIVDAGPVDENSVLSQAPDLEGMAGNPFKNFWNTPAEAAPELAQEILPPTVVLNGTLTADAETPMALIDGSLRFLGDDVGGWELAEVRSRSVILRAPTQEWVVVEMPLLQAEIHAPVAIDG